MKVIGLLLSLLLLYSCEESRTACLDFYASNYDFGAVEGCDSCCVYPSFKMDFDFNFDTLSYNKDSLYVLASGDTLQINSFNLVFSDFRFFDSAEEYRIIDSILFDESMILDDYLLVRSNRTGSITIGHTNYEADLNELLINIGFSENIENASSLASFETNSQLQLALDSMYSDDLSRLNMFKTTITISNDIKDLVLNNNLISDVSYNIVETLEPGIEWKLKLTFDLNILFKDFNKDMEESEMLALIEQNLASALFIE